MSEYTYTYGEVLLSVEHVSLELGGKVILRDLNLEIKDIIREGHEQGQVVALLGPSGIGKTQFFRILAGLNKPTTGEVRLGVEREKVKRGRVGVVNQNYTLFPWRKVRKHMTMAARRHGYNYQGLNSWLRWSFRNIKRQRKEECATRVDEILQRFRIADYANLYPANLSGGQRQRVAIAQQLLCSDYFLLMDEPFSGLDVTMVDKVCERIKEVARMHTFNTIVVITHDVAAAIEVADTLWIMGREKDKPGATIVETHNLVDAGLAWRPDITQSDNFARYVHQIRNKFAEL